MTAPRRGVGGNGYRWGSYEDYRYVTSRRTCYPNRYCRSVSICYFLFLSPFRDGALVGTDGISPNASEAAAS